MNNTKWEEIRQGMLALGELSPQWRTKDSDSGHVSHWDGEWYYHFSEDGYDSIEWLEIATPSAEQRAAVAHLLRSVHVPGEVTDAGFRVYGYVSPGVGSEYL